MAAAEQKSCCDFKSNYPEVVIHVGKITFGEEQRNMKDRIKEIEAKFREQNKTDKPKKPNRDTEKAISQSKSELEEKLRSQATDLNQAACALLNSGGGVITAEIENDDYSYKRHRIGLDIEDSFRDCIQHKDFSDYFDFKQEESSMSIFVKSWSSENSAYPRVCSLNMGLYERSSSSAVKMKPTNAVHFLKRKKGDAKRDSEGQAEIYPSNVQKHSRPSKVQMEKDIYAAAAQFFERERLDFGEILDFTESTTVEFKDFPRDKDNYEFVRNILPRYASAFANTKGGYLIFGVDNHRRVVGCKRNICPSRFVEAVSETIGMLPIFHFCASEEKLEFFCKALSVYEVTENGEEKGHGYVFVVRIQPYCCIVFERTPDSWIIEDGEMKRLSCTEWTLLMTEEDPDVSHFAEGFQIEFSRSYKPPLSKSVYSNKGLTCVKTLQAILFPVNPDGLTWKPQEICEELFLEHPTMKDAIVKKMQEASSSAGILIVSRSWAVDVGLPKHPHVACDILFVAADTFPTLCTVTLDKGYSASSAIPVLEYSRSVACKLKQKLVNEGGYTQKVCVIPHLIEFGSSGEIETDLSWPVIYPDGYLVSKDGLEELLQALVIALLRFRSFLSDQVGCEFFNLLTVKQYEILTKNLHKSKRLFIYGLPGSGKTVVALQIIQKIVNIFRCDSSEILYICENRPLCNTVRKHNITESLVALTGHRHYREGLQSRLCCQVTSLGPEDDYNIVFSAIKNGTLGRMRVGNLCQTVTRVDFLNKLYSEPVKHIVIDEAQSFQFKDGDWYGEAVKLTEEDPRKPGVLWIFLDYLQTSHTDVSGLPDPSKQEPQEWLTTGVRNATQVYNVMMHVTEMIANDRPEHLKKVVSDVCQNRSLKFLSAIRVCAAVIELMQQKLCFPKEPDTLYDQLKNLQAVIQLSRRKVLYVTDLYSAMLEFRMTMLHFPQKIDILYEQLKKMVNDPPDDYAVEALDAAQLCIVMIEFMHEILCFPKRFELFFEEFNKMLDDAQCIYDIETEENPPLGDPWTHGREGQQKSLQRLNIPYEQLNRLVDEAQCGHSLQGIFDMHSMKNEDEIATRIVHKCLEYFGKGYSVKNIAILYSSVEERDSYKCLLEREMRSHTRELRLDICFATADMVEEKGIVVDTIQHFSGLERSIVFAVFPYAESTFLIPHMLVCMVSRANLHCHILLDQSKGFCYIASTIENQSNLLGYKQ